ncbi:MAG: carbohydrate kinase family protein [Sporolactobacillus sp.]
MNYDVLTTGYVSMDRIIKINRSAQEGFTSLINNKNHTKIYYGGCSVNIAVALSMLKKKALPIIRVGDDYESIGFKDFLLQHDISLEGLTKIDGELTSSSYLIENPQGNHVTLFHPGAMDEKYSSYLNDHLFENAKLAVMTVGSMRDNQIFFEKCKKHHIPLVFGMKLDTNAFPIAFLIEVLKYATIVFSNDTEKDEIEQQLDCRITDLFQKGCAQVIVTTCGSKGSIWYQKNDKGWSSGKLPAYSCQDIVDTTGSGDAYLSGFIYGYLSNYDIATCSGLGATLASFVLESEGCCTNLPSQEDLLERYKNYLTSCDF